MKVAIKYLLCCYMLFCSVQTYAQPGSVSPAERICGKWESAEKLLIIQVYVENNEFKAKIIWFRNTGGKPMDYWTDRRNPDPKLKGRKLLGMSILTGLKYNSHNNSWEDGTVYDSRHGRYWNASGYIDKTGQLRVRGYWHFKFIGRTMRFYRVY